MHLDSLQTADGVLLGRHNQQEMLADRAVHAGNDAAGTEACRRCCNNGCHLEVAIIRC